MRWLIALALGIPLLTGCDVQSAAAPTPRSAPTTQSAPTAQVADTSQAAPGTPGAYPAPEGAYPGPQAAYPSSEVPLKQGPKFTIDEPIKISDSQVTGTGPKGVKIKLIDITSGGEDLSETTIGDDGVYKFDVAGKLKSGDQLAVRLAQSQGSDVNPEDFLSGPGYQDIPFVGIVFVSAHVQ